MPILMTTTDGTRFTLDDDGAVLARSNGPAGHDYSGEWRILGFRTRHNAHQFFPLARALNGADVGQGWVVDLDHGTQRTWMGSPGRLARLERIRAND